MRSMATLFPVLLLGAGTACTGDEFTAGSGGGGAGATSTTTSSPASSGSTGGAVTSSTTTGDVASSSTGSGGGCPGCIDLDGACRETTSAEFCGPPGADCMECSPAAVACQIATCDDAGLCGEVGLDDSSPCGDSGACVGGACDEDAEVCINDLDDDDDDAIDCLDDDCSDDHTCSVQTEEGWEGPFLVIESAGEEMCPPGLAKAETDYLEPEGACNCTLDVPCGLEVGVSALDRCAEPITMRFADDCHEVPGGFNELATGIDAIRPFCSASTDDPPESPGRTVLTACQLFQGGCNDLAVCMPPQEEANRKLCVRQVGVDLTCPDNFLVQSEVWDEPDLECPCKCTIQQGACDGTLQTFTDADCSECLGQEVSCGTLDSPQAQCEPYVGELASHAKFVRTTADATPVPDPAPRFVGDATITYCCRDYGP